MTHRPIWLLALALLLACGERAPVSGVPSQQAQPIETSPRADASTMASASPPPSAAADTSRPEAARQQDPVFRAILDAVIAHRPGYRFHFTPGRLEGDWRLDGEADGGTGQGRLFIDLTRKAGAVTANPCGDPDFVQGGRCIPRLLPTGSRLALRGLVEANGTRTVLVALIHPDRTGLTIEASNFTINGRAVIATRTMPLYTVNDLADLALAIDDRLRALDLN